jgi:hypothetical protein
MVLWGLCLVGGIVALPLLLLLVAALIKTVLQANAALRKTEALVFGAVVVLGLLLSVPILVALGCIRHQQG